MTPEEMRRKRSKGEIACAECRRLKLKCDKKIPCGTCVRRGCSTICPHGSLGSTSAQRVASMDLEHVQDRLAQMSERITVLEEALQRAHGQLEPGKTHPLLTKEFLAMKNISPDPEDDDERPDEHGVDGHGALAIASDGAVQYFGRMAGTEMLFASGPPDVSTQDNRVQVVPDAIQGFSDAFPFYRYRVLDLQEGLVTLINSLPPREEAAALVQEYFNNAGTHFRPCNPSDMQDFVLDAVYDNLPANGVADFDVESSLHPHLFALLYSIFAASALLDLTLPEKSVKAEQYHHLSKAALAMKPVFDETTLWTVVALGFLAIYLHGTEKSRTQTQGSKYWGITCLLSQSLGLHRDPAKWDLPPRIVELRRRVFWAINSMDHFQTLTTGYPAFFPAKRVDCEFPIDEDETVRLDGEILPGFWAWRYATVRAFLSDLNAATTNASPPSYQTVMALDAKIREFHKPWQRSDPFEGLPKEGPWGIRMQRFIPVIMQYFSLLYLHRAYFAQCCQESPTRPTKHPYAASYIATYDSAIRTLDLMKKEAQGHMQMLGRIPYIWTHVFAAAIIVGTAIERGPNNAFASSGLIELAQAVGLFEEAAKTLRRARIALPYLTALLRKAHRSYTEYNTKGVVHPSPPPDDEEDDVDLALFAGQTRLFYSGRSGSRSSGSSNSSASPPGPAAVLEAIQSVSALQTPSPVNFGHTLQRSDVGDSSGSFTQSSTSTTADLSQFMDSYTQPQFPSTMVTGMTRGPASMFAMPHSSDMMPNAQAFSSQNNDFSAMWGMSNLMSSVDGAESTQVHGQAFSMFPNQQQLPNDAVNLFGLAPSVSTTQADESWAAFLRNTGLFFPMDAAGHAQSRDGAVG